MSLDWADESAKQLLTRGLLSAENGCICLILGAVDTGKTTLAFALAKRLAARQAVGIIDADVGQSHIGPPTTVGWAVIDNPQADLSQIPIAGIAFVGDVTPVGHLLQLTAAIVCAAAALSSVTKLIIIDTPGFIRGPAASALWWTVHQILKPGLILAVQRSDELSSILAGLKFSRRPCGGGTSAHGAEANLERICCPPDIPVKSPAERRCYRQGQFNRYFRDSRLHSIDVSDIAVRAPCSVRRENLIDRLVGLRDEKGGDVAIGIITDVQQDGKTIVVKAPPLDAGQICYLVVGDITADIAGAAG